ncbi:MAG TPA: hypothetical protein PKD12_14760 [Nitrospira sp.]|nr:hypothetical protein [Nitrospira sp.]
MGEAPRKVLAGQDGAIALDTFGGRRIHVEWDPAAAVTRLGQLPFFIEFLKVSGGFEAWVADCPLAISHQAARDEEPEGSHQNVFPLQRVGRGRPRMGRGRK